MNDNNLSSRFNLEDEVNVDFENSKFLHNVRISSISFTDYGKILYSVKVPVGFDNEHTTIDNILSDFIKLRLWYNAKNIGKHLNNIEIELYQWCDEVNQSKIPAFRSVKKMIERHHDDIINYFKEGQTNAKAENMNSKIQQTKTKI